MSKKQNKYLVFCHVGTSDSGLTLHVNVLSKSGGFVLGRIFWFTTWRCYVFTPSNQTIWNQDCLRELSTHLETMNATHKKGTA